MPATIRALIRNGAVGFAGVLLLAACGDKPAAHAPPAPEVTVQTVDNQPVALELTYAARTAGSREVEVRARVGGTLLKRRFQEGSRVQQGQPMFLIDPEPVRARVGSARADVAVARARFEESRRQRDRVLPLFEQNAVSQSRRDEAVSAYEVAEANLLAAESQLRTAQLDLEYTDVRAPISGLTSREVLSEGSLVATDQDSSLLTRIVQVDPLYIEFAVPEAEAAMIRSSLVHWKKSPAAPLVHSTWQTAASSPPAKGATFPGCLVPMQTSCKPDEPLVPANVAVTAQQPRVKLVLENGSEYPQAANVTFVDNAVEVNSGTVRVRAVLPNKDTQLLPGQFIRAKVEGVLLSNVVAIPRKAVMAGPQGSFVYVVGADAKVQMRPVQVARSMGNNVVITDGLQAGDRYIVEGVLKVQPGIQVSAVTAEEAARQPETQARQAKEAA